MSNAAEPTDPGAGGVGPAGTAPMDNRAVGRASAFLASGTIVSRLLGFISAAVLARTLGLAGSGAGAFGLANQLPNNIYAIVAGGLLSAVLVPQIVRAALHDDGGQKFINRLMTLGGVVFLAAAVIATLCAPLLVNLYAQQSAGGGRGFTSGELALATAFAYWCLPQILFYALYSLLGEVLNARKLFGPFTWAPVVNNVVAIAGLLAFSALFGSNDVQDAAAWTPGMIAMVAGTASLGVAAQALVLFLFWRRAGLRYRPEFRWRGVGLGRVGKAAGWTFGMLLVTQLAGIVQSRVASFAGTDTAAIPILRYSWLIFMLPHSIVTVSIATAYFTRLSSHARDGNHAAIRDDVSGSLRAIGLIMVFAAVGLIVIAYPFSTIFAKGGFGEVQAMGNVLMVFLVGLIPFSILFVLQRTFYAVEDTRTPFFIQLVQAVLFVVGALFVTTLAPAWIAVGIAAVTTIAGTVQAALSAILLRRHIGRLDAAHIVRSYLVYLLAAAPAAAVGIGVEFALGGFTNGFAVNSVAGAVLTMIIAGVLMLGVYIGGLVLLRAPELRAMATPVLARLRRR
ncbi:MAG: putative peptidoglycan lipid flippase [Actinomycetota bacterium]|nr:putative peptidoglycan lipid flippase [Actinomycetota bacterium]